MGTDQILKEARQAYEQARTLTSSSQVEKSGMWSAQNKQTFWERGRSLSLEGTVKEAMRARLIAFTHPVHSKAFGLTLEELKQDFASSGMKLDELPESVEESDLLGPELTMQLRGRRLSTDFLYRLRIWSRLRESLPSERATVLEIGAGLGNLARVIKLLQPGARYMILDLPETLFFSHLFLRYSFPEARTLYITDPDSLLSLDRSGERPDFIFIPAGLYRVIPRMQVDLVVNTHSLGEMRQETVEAYLWLIQQRLEVRFLYSLNRFLQIDPAMGNPSEATQATCSLPLDRDWKLRSWNYPPPFVRMNRIPGDTEETLEVFAERIRPEERDPEGSRQQGRQFLKQAQECEIKGSREWLRLMWEAVRLNLDEENIRVFYDYLSAAECRERRYYAKRLQEVK